MESGHRGQIHAAGCLAPRVPCAVPEPSPSNRGEALCDAVDRSDLISESPESCEITAPCIRRRHRTVDDPTSVATTPPDLVGPEQGRVSATEPKESTRSEVASTPVKPASVAYERRNRQSVRVESGLLSPGSAPMFGNDLSTSLDMATTGQTPDGGRTSPARPRSQ